VDRARTAWIRKLVDLSRRNNLLYFRKLKVGTLDLTATPPSALQRLFNGASLALSELVPEDSADLERAGGAVFEIRRKAQENDEERGLRTLNLALGSVTWSSTDGGRPSDAPLLLLPVEIESRGRDGHNLAIRRGGDLQVNEVLLQALEEGHGLRIPAEQLLNVAEPQREPGVRGSTGLQLEQAYAKLRALAHRVPGLKVEDRVVLGNFAFQKMAIVRDLQASGDTMAAHNLIAALAGVEDARDNVRGARTDVDARTLDLTPPEEEFLILDADSSQQRVMRAVLSGQDGVIQGPPGTGKSQTIANLIAELAARGKKVLFVAEKRAALEVVKERLDKAGLGHLVLDLHGAEVSRRDVMTKLAESLAVVQNASRADEGNLFQAFTRDRQRLNAHAARLHQRRKPSDLSVYSMQGRLLGIPPESRSAHRWRGQQLDVLDARTVANCDEDVRDLAALGSLVLSTDSSPWTGADIPDAATAQAAADLSQALKTSLAAIASEARRVATEAGFSEPSTIGQLRADLDLCSRAEKLLGTYDRRILTEPIDGLVRDLAPAGHPLKRLLAVISNSNYRAAVRRMRELRKEGRASAPRLLEEAKSARDLAMAWKRRAGGTSRVKTPRGIAELRALLQRVRQDLSKMGNLLGDAKFGDSAIAEVRKRVDPIAEDGLTPHRIARARHLIAKLEAQGIGPFISELRTVAGDPSLWPQRFQHAWLSSCIDRARTDDPEIAVFDGRTHDGVVREFRELDERRIKVAAARVVRAHAERVVAALNADPNAESLVRREAQKRARHMPLRKLMEEAGPVVSALRPCLMASPLSVSQLLPGGAPLFDVILFDEASQILPEDAAAALLRGKQAVIAGDPHQLPPTTFFAAQDEGEQGDLEIVTEGFESLLDLVMGFLPPWTLDWHYRSLDESLIAFSNRHIYGDRLVTFPGTGRQCAVSHVLVEGASGSEGEEDSSSAEVRSVVELVLKHAEEHPEETLGVIAMGIKHATRIEAQLDRARESRPDLDPFFDSTKKERFFVKNLERVQGDERDAIILSIGYGKDRTGRLLYRFGPLLTKGGERRLNVAITRARRALTLVSSFDHNDMDPSRSSARGVVLLRGYLEFVASGGRTLGGATRPQIEMNEFERDIYGALTVQGIDLEPQWGVSRYRIDFAAKHPKHAGRFVLAIECDGAAYHSAPTARDRDRLRQKHLEALGWRFHRIWSTDWFHNRTSELSRAVEAYRLAVRQSDADVEHLPTATADVQRGAAVWSATHSGGARRGPRPNVAKRRTIAEYSDGEILQIIHWVESGTLRTVQQLIDETVEELGARKTKKAVARVRDLIARLHAQRGAA